ncbi:MAG: 16S rRNA (guanine(527)-N(7))-methyltransferase RsmG [Peptococcaceae bacterium]|jgi:16S rRNA (guanine527-N7)-methyltransferase|nr:16S rRNA (guanine(527)-N(7))-methyltransferase RsmG [Peptococcaceae bacterium]
MPTEIPSKYRNSLESFQNTARRLFDIDISEAQLKQFAIFTDLLLEWNERINLTAITELDEIMVKHFLDSLIFCKWLDRSSFKENIVLADLGTGAGFPGIPLKIIFPQMKIVLIDSLNKRINFLNIVKKELCLENLETHHARAEDIGRDINFRQTFDIVVARAVAELAVLLEYCSPLLKVGGHLLAAKGQNPEAEVTSSQRALAELNCKLEMIEKYSLAENADKRSLIIISKTGNTPQKYPRQAGKPKKKPL